jgi:hypothetical protein
MLKFINFLKEARILPEGNKNKNDYRESGICIH